MLKLARLAAVLLPLLGCNPGDEGPDGGSCSAPRKIGYERPGCGSAAVPICGHPLMDGCLRLRCSCSGKVTTECDYGLEPFARFIFADATTVKHGDPCDPNADGSPTP